MVDSIWTVGLQAVLLDSIAKSIPRDLQMSRGPGNVPGGEAEGLQQMIAFDAAHRFSKGHAARG